MGLLLVWVGHLRGRLGLRGPFLQGPGTSHDPFRGGSPVGAGRSSGPRTMFRWYCGVMAWRERLRRPDGQGLRDPRSEPPPTDGGSAIPTTGPAFLWLQRVPCGGRACSRWTGVHRADRLGLVVAAARNIPRTVRSALVRCLPQRRTSARLVLTALVATTSRVGELAGLTCVPGVAPGLPALPVATGVLGLGHRHGPFLGRLVSRRCPDVPGPRMPLWVTTCRWENAPGVVVSGHAKGPSAWTAPSGLACLASPPPARDREARRRFPLQA